MRLSGTPPIGLIAAHAALITGVHGISGNVVGTTDSQTLTNKILSVTSITVINAGAGADPILTSDYVTQSLKTTGDILATLDMYFYSNTAFYAKLTHTLSTTQTFVFPDTGGNVIVDNDTGKSLSLAQLTIENAGAGTDPVLSCNSSIQLLALAGLLQISGDIYAQSNINFQSSTAFSAILSHNISANRTFTFPDVAGTICLWNAANAAVTRYYSVGGHAIVQAVEDDGTHRWVWDTPNEWAQSAVNGTSWMPINLPDGAIVTAFRVTCQDDDTAGLTITIQKRLHSSGATAPLASIFSTASMAEISDTSITNATIDNNLNSYHIKIIHHTNASECRIQAYQIDYTVTSPYP